jgi:sugar lactone lactonase YvrE
VSADELCRIPLPTSHITNCAFSGHDLRTLYITSATSGLTPAQREAEPEAGGLFAVQLDVPGLPASPFGG